MFPIIKKLFLRSLIKKVALFFTRSVSMFSPSFVNVEDQTLSAIEAAKEINQVKDNLAHKQTYQFLLFTIRSLMVKLKDSGSDINEEFVISTAAEFYKTSRDYLKQWTCLLTKEMEVFYWTDLKKAPAWKDLTFSK